MRMRFLSSIVIGELGSLLLLGCGAEAGDESAHVAAVGKSSSALALSVPGLAPSYDVTMCFEEASNIPLARQNIVRDAIMNTWGAVTQLKFHYWGPCAGMNNSAPFRVRVRDTKTATGYGAPADAYGLTYLQLPFPRPDTEVRNFAAHEFGHCLGMEHEQLRNDAPFATGTGRPEWNFADPHELLGPYDPISVMNYNSYNFWQTLSPNDIRGASKYYGTRDYRTVSWYANSNQPETAVASPFTMGLNTWITSVGGAIRFGLSAEGQLEIRFMPHNVLVWSAKLAPMVAGGSRVWGTYNGVVFVYDYTERYYPYWSGKFNVNARPTFSVQRNGNVTLSEAGTSLWATNTSYRDELDGGVGLIPGRFIGLGESIGTPMGRFALTLNADGDLSVDDLQLHQRRWHSNTAGYGIITGYVSPRGDLNLLNANMSTVWTMPGGGVPGSYVALRDDGMLQMVRPAQYPVWRVDNLGEHNMTDAVPQSWSASGSLPPVTPSWPGTPLLHSYLSRITAEDQSAFLELDPQTGVLSFHVIVPAGYGTPQRVWSTPPGPSGHEYSANLEATGALCVMDHTTGQPQYCTATAGFANTYLAMGSGRFEIVRIVTQGTYFGIGNIGFAH